MYSKRPSAAELAAFGLTLDDVAVDAPDPWPDNMQAAIVFGAMSTQWRVGMNGPTGLDYGVLPEVWRRTKTPKQDRDDVFECLRVMESEALRVMNEKQP